MSGLDERLASLSPEKRRLLSLLYREQRPGSAPNRPESGQGPRKRPFSLISPRDRAALPEDVLDAYPLTMLQAGMIYHAEQTPEYPLYHNVSSSPLRGVFVAEIFQRCIERVVTRHAVLRTSFDMTSYSEPLQLVHRRPFLPVGVEDLRPLPAAERERRIADFVQREKRRRFDLRKPPLLRIHVHLRDSETFQFTVTDFHPILDGWSLSAMLTEILGLYTGLLKGEEPPAAPPPALTFGDYVALERAALESPECQRFWEEALGDATVMELPRWPGRRPEALDHPVLTQNVRIQGTVLDGLRTLARSANVPVKSVLLAAHLKVMGLLAGGGSPLTGLTVHGRPEGQDSEKILGLFLNTVPLKAELSPCRWRELVRCTFEAERGLLPFRRYPLAALQQRRSGQALFPAAFNMVHFHVFGGMEQAGVAMSQGAGWELEENHFPLYATFALTPASSSLILVLECQRAELCEEQALAIAGYYRAALDAMAADPEGHHDAACLLSAAEARQVTAGGDDTVLEALPDGGALGMFDRQAELSPERVAVGHSEEWTTYGELLRRVDRLATVLGRLGVGPEVCVGLCLERSTDLVTAMLAVLRAGGLYLPLDPAHPRERVSLILEDARPALLLTRRGLGHGLPAGQGRTVFLDGELEMSSKAPVSVRSADPAGSAAYLIYTSGSTGKPKGVCVLRRSLANFLASMALRPGLGEADVLLAVTTCSFDIAGLEIYLPLTVGGRVVIADLDVSADGVRLAAELERVGATVLQATPATWQMLLEAGWRPDGSLSMLCGGEALPRDLADRLLAGGGELWNLYGPTETTIWSGACRVAPGETPVSIAPPIANTRLLLLDPHLQPLPLGAPGHLYIGGEGLARGYHGQPGLTAERFVPDPFAVAGGGRLYWTGDRARSLPDGRMEFLGRADQQVKLRGFRIEPGEIESALRRHAGVSQAVVVVREDTPGDRRLVAYLVAQPEPTARELRDYLRQSLPEFMVPAAFVVLPALPLTSSGKVDRKSLPQPERPLAEGARDYVAPRTQREELLAQIWASVLGVDRAGLYDDFFDLGGHSLLATQMIARVREAFQVDLPLRHLFQAPSLAGLSERIETAAGTGGEAGGAEPVPPIPAQPRTGDLPLSFAQQRLWFLHQFEPDSAAYNIPATLWLRGALDREALWRSLGEVARRHEVLRTTFDESGGRLRQIVHTAAPVPLPLTDLSALGERERQREVRRLARREARRPFDLVRGPLLRATLLRLDEEEHAAIVVMHHIVSDGWSMGLLVREVASLYVAFAAGSASPLPELPIQYADYAAWQREWLQGAVLEAQLAYWRRQLAGSTTVLDLPVDRPRPAAQTFLGATRSMRWPRNLAQGIRDFGRRETCTLFMTLYGALAALLYRSSGQADLSVGTPIAGRTRTETEGLIGLFANTLVLRISLEGDPSFQELARRAREVVLAAHAQQDLPFEKLVEELQPERSLGHSPLFQVLFVLQNVAHGRVRLPGLTIALEEPDSGTSKFDLTLVILEEPDRFLITFEYNTALFDAPSIGRLLNRLTVLVDGAVTDPGRPLSTLDLLSAHEKQQVLREWNDTASAAPVAAPVHELFADRTRRSPSSPAVVFAGGTTTYGELERRANRLACHLRSLGAGPEVVVGIFLERSPEMVVALLAVLKSGAAYLPLDPEYPRERIELMLRDSGASLVLTEESLAADLPQTGHLPVLLGGHRDPAAARSGDPLGLAVSADSLAYLIYTSGSTGVPKAVQVTHGSLTTFLETMGSRPGFEEGETLLAVTSLSFDIAALEIFLPLVNGGRVELVRRTVATDGRALAAALSASGATAMQATPATWRMLLESGWNGHQALRIFCGGEALSRELAQELCRRGAELWNLYGPTETTIWSAVARIDGGERVIGIGRPIADTQIRLVDGALEPVPPGVPGELLIGGRGCARGYFRRPALTAEKFVPDPFSDAPGARLYRTGDLARLLPDGTLEVLGRLDHQVKIRGHRIELGEIEAHLEEHPAVLQAVVQADVSETGDRSVLAYVVPAGAHQPETALEAAELSQWREVWEDAYRQPAAPGLATFHIGGWRSSYTGQPITNDEMAEWVERTVERIVELRPERVLEIGCGTGLLLFRLAPRCRRYLATDFSSRALAHVGAEAQALGLEHVELLEQAADCFDRIVPGSVDTVILNSVAQYFPSLEYFLRVVEGALRALAPGGRIFLGDLRSLPLLAAFHASVELHRAADALPREPLRRRVELAVLHEEELLLDPGLFAALPRRWPQIGAVEVLPKRGRGSNEMTRFRYDAILHLAPVQPDVRDAVVTWRDWQDGPLTLADLRHHLDGAGGDAWGLRGVPNARVVPALAALRELRREEGAATAGELRTAAEELPDRGLDPEDLWELGQELSWETSLSWLESGAEGRFDVLFRRRPGCGAFLADAASERPWESYANDPVAARLAKRLPGELRTFLRGRLPEPMIPAGVVVLESFPLTPNGKIDRRALSRSRLAQQSAVTDYRAPRTPLEERLAEIWSRLLGLDRIGIEDNFFDRGGHSLVATQVVSRLRDEMGVDLPLRTLFEVPTVASLARRIESAGAADEPEQPPLARVSRQGDLRLSFSQHRLWFQDRLDPGSPDFNMPAAVRIDGALAPALLAASFTEILRRHEVLRTRLVERPGAEEPVQVVGEPESLPLGVVDLTALGEEARRREMARCARQEAARPFDVANDLMVRTVLLYCGETEHVLLLTLHHIAADGWSLGILVRELVVLYGALSRGEPSPLPALVVQYADFAEWQRRWLTDEVLERQLAYWRRKLAGDLPVEQLPTDRPRPEIPRSAGADEEWSLDAAAARALDELARREGATWFMVLLAGLVAQLHRTTGREDVVLGTDVANRGRVETEGLIGFFVNQLVLRIDVSGDPTFVELLRRARETALEAYAHQDLPFERLAEALRPVRSLGPISLFQIKLIHQNVPVPSLAVEGLRLAPVDLATPPARFELALFTESRSDGQVAGRWVYNRNLFAGETVRRLSKQLRSLLESVASRPHQRLSRLEIHGDGEARREREERARARFQSRKPKPLRLEDLP